jgi:hypothetical protein
MSTRQKEASRAKALKATAGPAKRTPRTVKPATGPTRRGRRLLALLAQYRAAWAPGGSAEVAFSSATIDDDVRSDEAVCAATDIREAVGDVAREIAARRPRGMSGLIDRVIVMTWLTVGQIEPEHRWADAIVAPLLALGGVQVWQCSEEPDAAA